MHLLTLQHAMISFHFKGNPSIVKPANSIFNHLAHITLAILVTRKQKVTLLSYILHFDYRNARNLILVLLISGRIVANPVPVDSNCGICDDFIDNNDKTINLDKCQFWCHIQSIGFL